LAHFGIRNDLESDAHDLVQQSLYAVLRGIHGKDGRKPNSKDLRSTRNFLNYLRGVVNSTAEGWARTYHRENGKTHQSLDLIQECIPDPKHDQIEYKDLERQFFTRLRSIVPARLKQTVNAWEKAPDGLIPCVISRKHVCSVRKYAQGIAMELLKK
jgi:DNA-directed RNA polymerase specialized sigma24 family protein